MHASFGGVLAAAALLLAAPAAPGGATARAQAATAAGPRIEITLPTATSGVTLRLREAVEGGRFEELLRSGFDVRVHLKAELWTIGRVVNDVVAAHEWDLLLHYDQFDQVFDVARLDAQGTVTPLGTYRRLEDAKRALALPFTPPLPRPVPGPRYYYRVTADVETLDLRDLDELTRWLRGELAPAMQGQRNPGTALGRGLRTLVSRVMGGEVRRLEARSPRFVVAGGS